jgi:hypothetical protein
LSMISLLLHDQGRRSRWSCFSRIGGVIARKSGPKGKDWRSNLACVKVNKHTGIYCDF